jgi:hypothetical protein
MPYSAVSVIVKVRFTAYESYSIHDAVYAIAENESYLAAMARAEVYGTTLSLDSIAKIELSLLANSIEERNQAGAREENLGMVVPDWIKELGTLNDPKFGEFRGTPAVQPPILRKFWFG